MSESKWVATVELAAKFGAGFQNTFTKGIAVMQRMEKSVARAFHQLRKALWRHAGWGVGRACHHWNIRANRRVNSRLDRGCLGIFQGNEPHQVFVCGQSANRPWR